MRTLLIILMITPFFLFSCSADPEDCQLADWVGVWARVDGGGCDNWEESTNETLTISQSNLDPGAVRIHSLPDKTVDGCELEHDFAGVQSTWTIKRNGQIRFESDLKGCWAEYEKE